MVALQFNSYFGRKPSMQSGVDSQAVPRFDAMNLSTLPTFLQKFELYALNNGLTEEQMIAKVPTCVSTMEDSMMWKDIAGTYKDWEMFKKKVVQMYWELLEEEEQDFSYITQEDIQSDGPGTDTDYSADYESNSESSSSEEVWAGIKINDTHSSHTDIASRSGDAGSAKVANQVINNQGKVNAQRSFSMMPPRFSDAAPNFDGNPSTLQDFFTDVDKLCDQHGVGDNEKPKWAMEYVERKDTFRLWCRHGLQSKSWQQFKEAITNLYYSELLENHATSEKNIAQKNVKSVESVSAKDAFRKFVNESQMKPINILNDLTAYYGQFQHLSKASRKQGHMDIDEMELIREFMCGLNQEFRMRLCDFLDANGFWSGEDLSLGRLVDLSKTCLVTRFAAYDYKALDVSDM